MRVRHVFQERTNIRSFPSLLDAVGVLITFCVASFGHVGPRNERPGWIGASWMNRG